MSSSSSTGEDSRGVRTRNWSRLRTADREERRGERGEGIVGGNGGGLKNQEQEEHQCAVVL